MPTQLKHNVVSGLIWRGLERISTQGIQFIISIILARLLLPEDFGTLALLGIFIAVASIFAESGFGAALIQKKEVSKDDYCSVFYFNLGGAILLYAVLFIVAPWIATFYNNNDLVTILRVSALILIIQAGSKIQITVLSREMRFKLTFKISIAATIVSGAVGIGMAYAGFGLWSLVASSLTSALYTTAVLWLAVGWRPQWCFSWSAIQTLFGFSSKMLGSGLLDCVFSNLYTVIIGKLFNATALGYYNRGQSIPSLLVTSLNGTIAGVMFPALASCQHDIPRVKQILRRMLKTTTFLVFPALFGLAAVADPLVRLLLTDKWLPCVPYLQVSCITFAFWPIHVANLQAITAIGRSDIFLTLEIIKKSLVVISILITFRFGIMGMLMGQAVTSLLCTVVNVWPNRTLVHYTLHEQLVDILPPMLAAMFMAAPTYGIGLLISNLPIRIATQIAFGTAIYLALCYLFRLDSFRFLYQTFQNALQSQTPARESPPLSPV